MRHFRSYKIIGNSVVVKYTFDDFLSFCHECCFINKKDHKLYPIMITDIEMSSMMSDINRGRYLIYFDILEPTDLQLRLFVL